MIAMVMEVVATAVAAIKEVIAGAAAIMEVEVVPIIVVQKQQAEAITTMVMIPVIPHHPQ
jgi:hypothetical protein